MNSAVVDAHPTFERRLYGGVAALAALVVLTGFARSYYLRSLFVGTPLPVLLHVHGAIMSLWYALFVSQVALVAAHRVDLHRTLGIATATCAAVLVPVGALVALAFVRRSLPDAQAAAEAAGVATYNFVTLSVFAALVVTALVLRHRSDVHKRLMTLAALSLLGPPLGRLMPDVTAALVSQGLVLLPIVLDSGRNRRLHPAFGWGGALVLVSSGVAVALAESPAWGAFVLRFIG
jgi:hypothetical protein